MCRVPLQAASSLVAVCLVLCAPVGASALTSGLVSAEDKVLRSTGVRVRYATISADVRSAIWRSFFVIPPSEWVVQRMVTRRYRMSMSG